MTLPKITTPTYELDLPSTDEKVKFRPFLVKEEKILLIAMENDKQEEMVSAIKQIIKNCTFNKVDIDKIPLFDLEYIFLQLRAKSIGEVSNFRILCPDDKKTYANVEIDLTKVVVEVDEGHDNRIIIDDKKQLGIVLSYPSVALFKSANLISNDVKAVFDLIVQCVDHIFEGEKIYPAKDMKEAEITQFLDDLPQEAFNKIRDFFKTMPRIKHEIEIENPKTKVKSKIMLQGLQDFFELASLTST
ncbi:MAG: hypothetical protein QF864_04800 [SAR202 cluster bacterium]|nr:hypothetical protein [SAR202 cluster bacterium]